MFWTNYYIYLRGLENTQRDIHVLLFLGCIGLMFFIGVGIEYFKCSYLDKIKNESIRKFIEKL